MRLLEKVSTKPWTNFWQFGEFFSNPYDQWVHGIFTSIFSLIFMVNFGQICNRHMDPIMVYPNVSFATPFFTSVKKLRRSALQLQKSLPFLPPPCSQFQKSFETKRFKNAIHKSVVCRKEEYSGWNKKSMSWVVWICHPYAVAISKTVVAIQNQWIVHGAGRCELGNFHIPKTYESPGTLFEPVPSQGYKNKLQSICFSDPKIRGQRKFAGSLPKNILPENGLHPFLSREVANEWFETLNNGKKTHSLIQKYNDIYIYVCYTQYDIYQYIHTFLLWEWPDPAPIMYLSVVIETPVEQPPSCNTQEFPQWPNNYTSSKDPHLLEDPLQQPEPSNLQTSSTGMH